MCTIPTALSATARAAAVASAAVPSAAVPSAAVPSAAVPSAAVPSAAVRVSLGLAVRLVAWCAAGSAVLLAQVPGELRWGDERFVLSAHGGIVARRVPVDARPGPPLVTPRCWRIRVRIATRLEVGAAHFALDPAAVATVRAAFAEFGRQVLAITRGVVRIDAAIDELPQPLRVAAGRSVGQPFLTPTRERGFGVSGRGVDSVFLVFPAGHLDLPMLGGTFGGDRGPDGAGSTGLAYVAARTAELPLVILHEWCHQLEWLAQQAYGMPWLPSSHDRVDLGHAREELTLVALLRDYLSPEFLRKASMRGHGAVARAAPGLHRWDAVADDPWRRLPLLTDEHLGRLVGRPGVVLRATSGRVELRGDGLATVGPGFEQAPALDHVLDLASESVALVAVRGAPRRYVVLARGDVAALFGQRLRGLRRVVDGARTTGVAGVALPLRARRTRGVWSAGGTATPLVVFVTELEARPETELELLGSSSRGPVYLRRAPAPALVGEPLELQLVGAGAGTTWAVAGRDVAAGELSMVPRAVGPLVVEVRPRGEPFPLRYVLPIRDRISIDLRPRSGPCAVVRSGAHYRVRLHNHTPRDQRLALAARLPVGWSLRGLPEVVELRPGVQRELPCLVDVGGEAVAAPGVVHLGLEVRAARGAPARGAPVGGELVGGESVGGGLTSGELLGGVRRAVYAAPGAHVLRLDFEAEDKAVQLGDLDAAARSDHPLADLPAASSPGEWRASSLRGSAAVGDGFLRLNDGGGSRFGRHYLLGPSALTYDTKQFPYLTFAVRLPPPAAVGVAATTKARAALNIKVDEHTVSLMLRGRFVRAWDRRRELPGAGHDPAATGWQRVRYDLDAALDAVLGPGNHRVSAIDVGDPRALCSNRFTGPDTADIDLDDFAVAR